MAKKDEDKVTRKPTPEKKAGAQPIGGQMGGGIGSNLQLGGFGNPMGFTPSQPRSMFESSAEQFSRLPEQPARPSDLFSSSVPAFPSQLAQPMVRPAMDLQPAPSSAPTTDAITAFGQPLQSTTIRISDQYGTGSTTLTPEQQTARFQERQRAEQMGTLPRTPEQQQALLAQARQTGAAIGQTMREREAQRQQELTKGYYAFRQGLELDRFRKAMSEAEKQQSRGRSGKYALRQAEQARYGGEIMRQAGANVGTDRKTPFFPWEIASMPSGEKFYSGSMGEYTRVAGTGTPFGGVRGGPQPAAATPTSPQTSQNFNLMTPMPTISSPQSFLGGQGYSGFNLFDPLRGIYGA